MWIKICGNTSLEDARFAAECGADAVGFVFAPSPRRVEAELVRRITSQLPPRLEKYGVFVDAGFDEIVSTVAASGLTGVQIHRSADELLPSRLRRHFSQSPRKIAILRVLNYKNQGFEEQLTESGRNDAVDGVLVDSSTERAVGGTGTSFNWLEARSSFLRTSPASTFDCGRRPGPGKRETGHSDPAPLGRRCGERRRKCPGQEGFRARARFHPLSTGSSRRNLSDGSEMRNPS